jgi:hypothetical protein
MKISFVGYHGQYNRSCWSLHIPEKAGAPKGPGPVGATDRAGRWEVEIEPTPDPMLLLEPYRAPDAPAWAAGPICGW